MDFQVKFYKFEFMYFEIFFSQFPAYLFSFIIIIPSPTISIENQPSLLPQALQPNLQSLSHPTQTLLAFISITIMSKSRMSAREVSILLKVSDKSSQVKLRFLLIPFQYLLSSTLPQAFLNVFLLFYK